MNEAESLLDLTWREHAETARNHAEVVLVSALTLHDAASRVHRAVYLRTSVFEDVMYAVAEDELAVAVGALADAGNFWTRAQETPTLRTELNKRLRHRVTAFMAEVTDDLKERKVYPSARSRWETESEWWGTASRAAFAALLRFALCGFKIGERRNEEGVEADADEATSEFTSIACGIVLGVLDEIQPFFGWQTPPVGTTLIKTARQVFGDDHGRTFLFALRQSLTEQPGNPKHRTWATVAEGGLQ